MATTPVKWSHFNDPTRDRTPPTAEQKNLIINKIIEASSAAGLSKHDTAHVLALVNFESGFNPNAANPSSSASGLGQFIDSTGDKFGLRESTRWNIDKQINAVIEHFQENKALAEKNNLGEAGIYGAHHDGAAGVLKENAPGLSLAEKHVIPKINDFERLIDKKISTGEVAFSDNESAHKAVTTESSAQTHSVGNYNFPNTAGAGRGTVNPETVQAADSSSESAVDDISQQITDAFNQADQTATDIKAQYPGVQVADASGAWPDTSTPTSTDTTLPLILRRELIPVMRYGNYAGPGYAGHLGTESSITDPAINQGQPTAVADLVKTPQGLAQVMAVATKTEPNGYLDAVTRNHDVEYTVAEMRYMNKVQAQFDGKLPHELSAEDKASPAYQSLQAERNQEYWAADKRMLQATVAYQPTDFVDSTYRDLMVKGFYVKASDGLGGEYNIPELNGFFDALRARDRPKSERGVIQRPYPAASR